MFTGLVQKRGRLLSNCETDSGLRLVISCSEWSKPIEIGESICISGCCLSVVENVCKNGKNNISFDVIPETLACTYLSELHKDAECNVERSMRADDLVGGHFVLGHVDACEKVLTVAPEGSDGVRLRMSMDVIDRDTIVNKGSVAIDGVSLTISSVSDAHFEVALLPFTLAQTTLGRLVEGDRVHVESDMLGKSIVTVTTHLHKKK
ncbi:MAG: riboflavin synthase [Planctomycetes bacterium]|nr:riboflavin synthase [Planctomycetota bacterium]